MYRTQTCGELRLEHKDQIVTLAGWVQKSRDMGGLTFVDLRDRYGVTQLVFNMETSAPLCEKARKLGREFVIQVTGRVAERQSKNPKMPTGDIEIIVDSLNILNTSDTPPFTIEDQTDGGDELRMKYRYLDLRRNPVKNGLLLRHRMAIETRKYLDEQNFIEVETPVLIRSTPEGARDFVVPSRMNPGEFYALPQSPQLFKQLLMVSGFDRYYQIVKCFRDEDLRADRQPEFTQIDCEMSFVNQEDVLQTFEGMTKHLFKVVKGVELEGEFQRMTYAEAMESYGCDKPDLRFGMKIKDITDLAKGKGFSIFDSADYVGGICADSCGNFTRKQLDELTEFVKRPQVGAKGLIYVKYNEDGTFKSSVDKFFTNDDLKLWAERFDAQPGDLILVLPGTRKATLPQLCTLRLHVAQLMGLLNRNVFAPLWVVDFPLFEWDDATQRFYAMHHPFTSPKLEDVELLKDNAGAVRANAYDLVINGIEIGGGSIRIHDDKLQQEMFDHLGFTKEQAAAQFGFLMNAFKFGAPPHGGCAFGFDRLVALFNGTDSIRDVIAFPKNNAGRDVMNDSPSPIAQEQLDELGLKIEEVKK